MESKSREGRTEVEVRKRQQEIRKGNKMERMDNKEKEAEGGTRIIEE